MICKDMGFPWVENGDGVDTGTLLKRKMKLMSDKFICLMSKELMM
jgi:hypothetical protein